MLQLFSTQGKQIHMILFLGGPFKIFKLIMWDDPVLPPSSFNA